MIGCEVCKSKFKSINKRHLESHNLSRDDYVRLYPFAPLQSPESAEKRKAAALNREQTMSGEVRAVRSSKIASARVGKSSWNEGKGGYTLEWSDEAKANRAAIGAHNKGVPASEEQKMKQSKTMKSKFENGFVHWNLGRNTPDAVKKKISESNLGMSLTLEQKERHLQNIRIWVSSERYYNPRKGIVLSETERKKMSFAMIDAAPKIRAAHEAAGRWLPLSQLPEVVKYKREVRRLTNKNAHLIEGYDPTKRGRNSHTEQSYQIDHRISIVSGWAQGLTPEQMAHPANLRFIPWQQNLKKWSNSDLTKDELILLIQSYSP